MAAKRTIVSDTIGTEADTIGIIIGPGLVVFVPFDSEFGVWKENERRTFRICPIHKKRNIEGFVIIREFLYDIMVVVVESASVGDELDVIATDRIQFGGPELVMCGVIGEVNEGGYTIEFSVTEACHKGSFIELSELCPSNSHELFL